MLVASVTSRQPVLGSACDSRHDVQQGVMAPQRALLPMSYQRIEDAMTGEQLARIFLHPEPRAHLERQRQERAVLPLARPQIQVMPQVAVRQVLAALRLEDIGMVA